LRMCAGMTLDDMCVNSALGSSFAPAATDVRAIELQKLSKLNFWDGMILHAAAELGSSVL